MPDKPEQGKPDLESWFLGSEPPPVEEAVTIPPAPDPPPIMPEPEPEPESKPSNWARSAVLAAAMLAFGGAAVYHFYPSLIRHPDPVPVTPEPKPKPPDPPIPIPEPVPEPKKEEPQPPIQVEPPPRPPEPKKTEPKKEVAPPIVEAPPVKPEPVPPPVRKEEPRAVVVPDPGPQPPARPRLTRPDTNPIVTPPPTPAYSGPPSGVINWSGHLDKNGAVVIEGPATQSGTVNGSLPGVPVMIDVDTKEFAIAEAPSPSNGWKRLVIRSRRKVHSVVTIRWTVVQQ